MSRGNEDLLRGKGEAYRARAIEQKRTIKLADNERMLIELMQSLDSKYEGLVVVVEGKRDVIVLRDLGLRAPIIKTQTRLPRHRLIDQIAAQAGKNGCVLILTDYDQEGKTICGHIEKDLEPTGVKTLKGVRLKIRKLMGTWRCIEELTSLFSRIDSPERTGSIH